MLELFDVKYNVLTDKRSQELFTLRKGVFKDRLNWMVNIKNNMEADEYDCHNTTYVFGAVKNHCICSVRFIETRYPNMITHTFSSWFKKSQLPEGNFVEASRLFIDKERTEKFSLRQYPVSGLLFLSMLNYARHHGYDGIYAVVSHPMYIIFKRSGWLIRQIDKSISEKNKNVYLIFMPVDDLNQQILMDNVKSKAPEADCQLDAWPISFSIGMDGTN